jgi:undecaprenyl-diphosphatase
VVVTIAGAAWLLYRGKRRAALILLVASFAGRLLVILEKAYFARLRPDEHMRLVEVHYQSFPSGHAANTMIAFLALALLAFDNPAHRRWAVTAAVTLSVLIGFSRPMLGVHWPSDVVAGWAFGLFWTLLVLKLGWRWQQKDRVQAD